MRNWMLRGWLLAGLALTAGAKQRVLIWDSVRHTYSWVELGASVVVREGKLEAVAPPVERPVRTLRLVEMPDFIDWSKVGTDQKALGHELPADVAPDQVRMVIGNGVLLKEGVDYALEGRVLKPLAEWEDRRQVRLLVEQ